MKLTTGLFWKNGILLGMTMFGIGVDNQFGIGTEKKTFFLDQK